MAFKKKVWKDRLVEFAGRRTLKKISGSADSTMVVDVARNEGTVSQAGDAFSAANMNDLEQRTADEFANVNTGLTNVSVYVGNDGKLHFRNSAGADTALNFSHGNYNIALTLGAKVFNGLNVLQGEQELGTINIFVRNEQVSTDYQGTGNINDPIGTGTGQRGFGSIGGTAGWHMIYIKSLTIQKV